MTTIIVFNGETADQAMARSARWSAERRELLGYSGNVFIHRGRRCVASYGPSPPVFLYSPMSVAVAETNNQKKLEQDREGLITARARREARTPAEMQQLLREYGGSGG